jgi:hypothetical protein
MCFSKEARLRTVIFISLVRASVCNAENESVKLVTQIASHASVSGAWSARYVLGSDVDVSVLYYAYDSRTRAWAESNGIDCSYGRDANGLCFSSCFGRQADSSTSSELKLGCLEDGHMTLADSIPSMIATGIVEKRFVVSDVSKAPTGEIKLQLLLPQGHFASPQPRGGVAVVGTPQTISVLADSRGRIVQYCFPEGPTTECIKFTYSDSNAVAGEMPTRVTRNGREYYLVEHECSPVGFESARMSQEAVRQTVALGFAKQKAFVKQVAAGQLTNLPDEAQPVVQAAIQKSEFRSRGVWWIGIAAGVVAAASIVVAIRRFRR